MNNKISTPKFYAYTMIAVAVFLTFPAFGDILESQSLDLWNQRVSSMGILYSVGSLFWSFSSFIISLFLISFGINSIRKADNNMPN